MDHFHVVQTNLLLSVRSPVSPGVWDLGFVSQACFLTQVNSTAVSCLLVSF